jgi:hypothetical protein
MSFKILYKEGQNFQGEVTSMALYVNDFAKGLGIKELNVNPQAFYEVASALLRPDFPHKEGMEKASPFKKAAHFFVWFVASRPILDELPAEIITPQLKSIPNHQNVIFAYHMAVDCLHEAELHKNGDKVKLANRITVSEHFFSDFVETFSAAVPMTHYKPVTLLFEQLAYKANPSAPYDETI